MKAQKLRFSSVGSRKFTLIELLVVIAVIAVLAGMLLPALGQAKGAGQTAHCKGNIKSIYIACFQYSNDCKGWMPGSYDDYTEIVNMDYGIGAYIGLKTGQRNTLLSHSIVNKLFGCSAVKQWYYKTNFGTYSRYKLRSIAHITGNDAYVPRNINEFGKPNQVDGRGRPNAPSPSKCFYWGDASDCTPENGQGCFVYGWFHTWACIYNPTAGAGYTAFRHNKQMNFCTLSGDIRQAKGWYKMGDAAFWQQLGLRKADNWKIGRPGGMKSLERGDMWY